MSKTEIITIKSIIDGPMQIDDKGYTLLCLIETQDGKTYTDEVKDLTLNEAISLKSCVEIYGPQQVEATWVEDYVD